MSHFAKIDNNSKVVEVLTGDSALTDEQALEFITNNFSGVWIQTSYTGSIRYNYAGIGFTYDPIADAFYAPQPYPSWSLNNLYLWEAPVPYPSGGGAYQWDESTLSWIPIV